MELDGRTALFRWRDALTSEAGAVAHKDDLKCELNVPLRKRVRTGLRESPCSRTANRSWWYTALQPSNAKAVGTISKADVCDPVNRRCTSNLQTDVVKQLLPSKSMANFVGLVFER
jgi:hypothetical protein